MISNIDDSISYYDIIHNRIAVRGFSCSGYDDAELTKILVYPGVVQNIYCITKVGKIYSIVNNSYINWSFRGNLPYVNLSCMSERGCTREPFYIRDLVAYNFIANAESYLERGCRAVNVDGDPMNCTYYNIRYIDPSKGY